MGYINTTDNFWRRNKMEIDIDKIKTALENSNLIKTHKDLYWKLWTVITEYEVEVLNGRI